MGETFQLGRNAVYVLVLALSRENKLISYLGVLTILVDYLQLLSFGLGSPQNSNWQVEPLQNALFYFVLPWPVNTVTLCVLFALTFCFLVVLVVLFRQVYHTGGVTSVWLLRLGRLGMSLFSTILFFPFLETFLYPFKVYANGYPVESSWVVLAVFSLLLFSVPVLLFGFLCFSPDPTDSEDIAAKVSSRPEMLDLLCRTLIVFNATLNTRDDLRDYLYLLFLSPVVILNVVYPSHMRPWVNWLRGGLMGSLLWVALTAVIAFYTDKDTANILVILTLAALPAWGAVFSALVYWRLKRLNVVAWTEAVKQLKGSGPEEKGNTQKSLLEQFINGRCHFPFDIEIASRFCLHGDHFRLGVNLFESGIRKFPNSTYLHSRFALYIVFVSKMDSSGLRAKSSRTVDHSSLVANMSSSLAGNNDRIMASTASGMGYSSMSEAIDVRPGVTGNPVAGISDFNDAVKFMILPKVMKRFFAMNPYLDLRYIYFFIIMHLEQDSSREMSGEDKLHLLESIRFKHDFKMASRHHKKTLECIMVLWKNVVLDEELSNLVLKVKEGYAPPISTARMWNFSRIIDKIHEHLRSADSFYKQLLYHFPRSTLVCRMYSEFLRTILKEERLAMEVDKHCDFVETHREDDSQSDFDLNGSSYFTDDTKKNRQIDNFQDTLLLSTKEREDSKKNKWVMLILNVFDP
jgi:hypothetical protein